MIRRRLNSKEVSSLPPNAPGFFLFSRVIEIKGTQQILRSSNFSYVTGIRILKTKSLFLNERIEIEIERISKINH